MCSPIQHIPSRGRHIRTSFVTPPGETDMFMVVMSVFLALDWEVSGISPWIERSLSWSHHLGLQ
jgi:hypothetical protein